MNHICAMNEVCIHIIMVINRLMGETVFFIICIILIETHDVHDAPKGIRETTSFRS